MDVVDTGDINNWQDDPFSGKVTEDAIYGRGAQDMKVPMIVILNVLENLIDEGIEFINGIRFLIGTDEECEFRDMEKYKKEQKFFDFGFTPDSNFGVVNVESSLIEYEVQSDEKIDFKIEGGTGYNSVADIAYYEGSDAQLIYAYLTKRKIQTSIVVDRVYVYGKGVHVNIIEQGQNAITILISALYELGIHSKIIDYVYESFKQTVDASIIHGRLEDKYSGAMVCNIGQISNECVRIDLRIPVLYDEKIIYQLHIEQAQKYKLNVKKYFNDRKVFVSENNWFVQLFLKEYEKVTNLKAKAKSTRGGSYSKIADNIVGFGMNFPDLGQDILEHQANEKIEIKYIKLAYEIYYNTLKEIVSKKDM